MSDAVPARDVLLALAAKWRSEGEYWRGTPDDAARQECADDLLKVLGEDAGSFTMGHAAEEAALARYQLPGHPSNADRGLAELLTELANQGQLP